MEQFLKVASMAWRPVNEVRHRAARGELRAESVVVPFVGVVLACQAFSMTGMAYMQKVLAFNAEKQLVSEPLFDGTFAQQMIAAILVLMPLGAIALLPDRFFAPRTRSEVIATAAIVAAGGRFYQAAGESIVYLATGFISSLSVQDAIQFMTMANGVNAFLVMVLLARFWFRSSRTVLGIPDDHVSVMTMVAVAAYLIPIGLLLAWFKARYGVLGPA